MSHEAMAKDEKMESASNDRESQQSFAETTKKLAVAPLQSLTKEKGLRESFEKIDEMGQSNQKEERRSNLDHIEIMSLSNNFSALSPDRPSEVIAIRPR